MRLGIFGGTFDPIHLGHLILAETARERCGLDKVWFVPAGEPPHKRGRRTPVSDRLELVRLAIAGHADFELCELDARRPGPHYSVELLELARGERPEAELYFLIGADSLLDLPTWREPERIARMATIVVANRPGIDAPIPGMVGGGDEAGAEAGARMAARFGPEARPFRFVEIPPIGIASRELRRDVAEGRSIRYRVPRAVEMVIRAKNLYRGSEGGDGDGDGGG